MISQKQRQAAKKNIQKAQKVWKNMTKREHSLAQPEGRARKKPGTTGEGDYYHVVVRDKNQFTSFRAHDVGEEGHSIRVAGHRKSGSWDTQKWLIQKSDARVDENGYLHGTREETEQILSQLGAVPRRVKGDVFDAKPRPNVPERDKPTPAQQRARRENIQKAQKAAQRKDTSPYEERTYDELYSRAQELDISGRSSMTKDELIDALRAA